MAVLVGIDEAGYGPLLGPLVVSSASFSIPDDMLKADLWKVLEHAVGKTKRNLSGRILITDSKKAHTKASGVTHLRRGVLAALGCASEKGDFSNNARQLLDRLCPQCSQRLCNYPWYEKLDELSLEADNSDIEIASGVLKKALNNSDMALSGVRSRCLDVGYYNSQVDKVKNKSNVLFTALCGLILDELNKAPKGEALQVIVDRQGGRINYANPLMRMFPGMELTIIKQSAELSSYEMVGGGRKMRIHFTMKADLHFLPVSLASMTSKYVREVLIESLNNYFLGFCPEIKRTAGYWQDGQRFIKDIDSKISGLNYDRDKLVRQR